MYKKNSMYKKNKKIFIYIHTDILAEFAERQYRINCFNTIIDRIAHDVESRLTPLNEILKNFILFTILIICNLCQNKIFINTDIMHG